MGIVFIEVGKFKSPLRTVAAVLFQQVHDLRQPPDFLNMCYAGVLSIRCRNLFATVGDTRFRTLDTTIWLIAIFNPAGTPHSRLLNQ